MKCLVCGKENRNGAFFCVHCGSRLNSSGNIGKEKCEYLKSVRNRIAIQNNIPYMSAPCTSTAPCEGICPACEAETAALRESLAEKEAEGKTISYVEGAGEALSVSDDNVRKTPFSNKWNERGDKIRDWPELAGMPRRPIQPMGYIRGPEISTYLPDEPIHPKKESFLRKIKKAFGK